MPQIMISYRITDTGARDQGGDGTVVQIKNYLEDKGYSVFVGEDSLDDNEEIEWSHQVQNAVASCKVFVALCSPGYGETKWTYREFQLADDENKPIIPLWHSGTYPPAMLKIFLSGMARIPKGEKPLVQSDFRYTMRVLESSLAQVGCKPGKAKGPNWRPSSSPAAGRSGSARGLSPRSISPGAMSPRSLSPGAMSRPLSPVTPSPRGLSPTPQTMLTSKNGFPRLFLNAFPTSLSPPPKSSPSPTFCTRKLVGHLEEVTTVCWSPDGSQIASGSADRELRTWEPSTGRCREVLVGHKHTLACVGWAPDSRRLAAASEDGSVRVWNELQLEQRNRPMILPGDTDLTTMCWYPDSFHLMTCGADRTVRVWNAWLGARERSYRLGNNVGFNLALSPDGTRIAAAGSPPTVYVWRETTGGADMRVFEGHTEHVTAVAWSPDGRLLASASRDKTVRLWEVATGMCKYVLGGHIAPVTCVCWSNDGRQVASGSDDRTVRVWDVAMGICKRTLTGHLNEVTCVAWAPAGRQVASGSYDKTIRIWS